MFHFYAHRSIWYKNGKWNETKYCFAACKAAQTENKQRHGSKFP